jgi:starvation-inducible outer membrane lipoprotein
MWLCLIVLLALAGCVARNPLNLAEVDSTAYPDQMRRYFQSFQGHTVQWGGLIVERLDENGTPLLEILAYPLREGGNPDEYRLPIGLFLFSYTGKMDLTGQQPGLFVTVVGKITLSRGGVGGESARPLPVVTGDQTYLWGSRYRNDQYPRTTLGFGLGARF